MAESTTSQFETPIFPTLEPPPGNERIARSLCQAIHTGKVHHAYLFEGPGGVGKSQMATWFSALLFCEGELLWPNEPINGASVLPCGDCPSCHLLQKGEHPDYERTAPLEGRTKIVVDQVRQVVKHSAYRPLKSERRVFELRYADKMDAVPANALLKTLEEPATYNVFILITDRAHSLLDTIRSRCQNVRFAALDPSVVKELLKEDGLEPDDAHILASACGGSSTVARSLHEIGYVEQANTWLDLYINPLSDAPATPGMVINEASQLSTAYRRDPDALYGEIALLFRTLRLAMRDAILIGQGMPVQILTWPHRVESSRALSKALNAEVIMTLMERVSKAHELFDRPLNTTLILEDLLLRTLSARNKAGRMLA